MRLIDCFALLISSALHPKSLSLETDATEVHGQFITLGNQCQLLCDQYGFSRDQQQEALFAIVVWIDEQRLSNGELRQWWLASSLQNTLFNTTNGGDEFYRRLARIKGNDQLLEVYKHCLALGFRGNMFKEKDQFDTFYRETFACSSNGIEEDMPIPLFPESYGTDSSQSKRRHRIGSITSFIFTIVVTSALLGGLFFLGQKSLEIASSSLKTVGL